MHPNESLFSWHSLAHRCFFNGDHFWVLTPQKLLDLLLISFNPPFDLYSTMANLCRIGQNELIFNKKYILQNLHFTQKTGDQTLLKETNFCIFCLTFQIFRRFCDFAEANWSKTNFFYLIRFIISVSNFTLCLPFLAFKSQ